MTQYIYFASLPITREDTQEDRVRGRRRRRKKKKEEEEEERYRIKRGRQSTYIIFLFYSR